jgi:hypothetical protein
LKKLFCILILLAITLSFGCKKRYPDGPLISFRSPYKRIVGEWQIVSFTSDGVDSLQSCIDSCGSNMNIQISDPNNFWYNIVFTKGFLVYWNFSDNETIMNVNFSPDSTISSSFHYTGIGPLGGGKISEWKILKLEMKALEISTTYNGKSYLMSFKKE